MAGFSEAERRTLLAARGVGRTVVWRLEEMGLAPLPTLARAEPGEVVGRASAATGSTCWRNSPQARAAVCAAIESAREVARAGSEPPGVRAPWCGSCRPRARSRRGTPPS